MKYKCSIISKYKFCLNALLEVEAWERPPKGILIFFLLPHISKNKQKENIKHLPFGKHCAECLGTGINKTQFSPSRCAVHWQSGQVNQQLNQTALHTCRIGRAQVCQSSTGMRTTWKEGEVSLGPMAGMKREKGQKQHRAVTLAVWPWAKLLTSLNPVFSAIKQG